MLAKSNQIVNQMFSGDRFSKHLGIKIIEISEGYSKLEMLVRDDMLNGFDILHGGVSYSLADSCLAFAANSYGRISVSLNAKMSYPESSKVGDILTAESVEITITNKIGIYDVFIKNQHGVMIGVFRGTVYRTEKEFLINNTVISNE
ncbi:MAG: hotdog fold thioesterase [Candidatus Kapabacteria bacterium]|nr:hotdog fold thioesterase [Ignavibacteriota bacterium]MCW5885677.1 hotdog fold thioesterase [Candidatus Kapabacteria bacterium]